MKLKVISTEHCNQCRMLHKELDKNKPSIPIEYIDGDEMSDEMINELKIRAIPVTILMKENNSEWIEVNRWVGFTKTQTIEEYIKSL